MTKSALVQARQKLLPRFFSDFFRFSVAAFYQYFKIRRWKGFRVWSTDGSGFRLPDEQWLGEAFGWHGNQHNRVPSARMLVCYDLLNQLVTALQFHTRNTAEVVVAQRSIDQIPPDVLMVYDRGFAAHIIPFLHQHCWQDIYSHFILYNLQTALHQPLQKTIRKINATRQHHYKPNRNVSAGLLKRFVVKLCLCPVEELKGWLTDYYRQILQTLEPERPGKNKERRRRILRGTERHNHEKNYRRAF